MSDKGFKETIQLQATERERLRPAYMFIDATQFFHQLGEGVLDWRGEALPEQSTHVGAGVLASDLHPKSA